MSTTGRVRDWASRTRGRIGILHLRDLRFVTFSTLVSSLGDGIVAVALAFAVLDLTHSATDLGIVMAARTITIVAVTLIGGVVADRMSRRTVMMAADVLRSRGRWRSVCCSWPTGQRCSRFCSRKCWWRDWHLVL